MTTPLNDIYERRNADKTQISGGLPYNYIKLYGGKAIQIYPYEPDIKYFRDDYYYNSEQNKLYRKKSEWLSIDRSINSEDSNNVYINNRPVSKVCSNPDPNNFSDDFCYNISDNKIYRRSMRWIPVNNA